MTAQPRVSSEHEAEIVLKTRGLDGFNPSKSSLVTSSITSFNARDTVKLSGLEPVLSDVCRPEKASVLTHHRAADYWRTFRKTG